MRSGEMLPRIENRSGETFTRGEARFGRKDRGEMRSGGGSWSKGLRLPERDEERLGWKDREELRTFSGSWSEGLRLPKREDDFLEERFEREIGMAKSLYCFLHKFLCNRETSGDQLKPVPK